MLCSAEGGGNGAGAGTSAVAAAGCNNNWLTVWIGSRNQWNVTADTYFGLDVMYQRMHSASTANGLAPATTSGVSDNGSWSFRFRVHRDWYP
jgi:hypothetical protein